MLASKNQLAYSCLVLYRTIAVALGAMEYALSKINAPSCVPLFQILGGKLCVIGSNST